MKKSIILLASVFLALFLGILLSVSFLRSYVHLNAVELRRASSYAFYAAEAAIDRAVDELRRNMDWQAGFGDGDSPIALVTQGATPETVGFYWIDADGVDDISGNGDDDIQGGGLLVNRTTVWIRAHGQAPRLAHHQSGSQRISRVIFARVAVENPAVFFTSTLNDLTIASGIDIDGDVFARDIVFEVNESLPSPFKEIEVDGDVLYIRDIEGETNPSVTIAGNTIHADPITFASVDSDRYRDLAKEDGKYINGDFTFSGTIDKANLGANNGLIYAEGNIYIAGDVTESMHIVAGGNIYITGDVTCQGDAQIGLSAKNDVIIDKNASDTLTIDAFIHVEGSVFKAEGDKYSKDILNFEGAISVKGKEGEKTAVDLLVYTSRNYVYDQGLVNNLSIPFMSFIANIVEWREVPLSEADNFPPS